jgi:hypothetical protein
MVAAAPGLRFWTQAPSFRARTKESRFRRRPILGFSTMAPSFPAHPEEELAAMTYRKDRDTQYARWCCRRELQSGEYDGLIIKVANETINARKLPPGMEFDDVFNDAYIEAETRIQNYDPFTGSFATFLAPGIRNCVSNLFQYEHNRAYGTKRRKRSDFAALEKSLAYVREPAASFAIADMLDALPEVRQAVAACRDCGVSEKEVRSDHFRVKISKRTGMSKRQVETLCSTIAQLAPRYVLGLDADAA